MSGYTYKQNTGILSKNQYILKNASVTYIVNNPIYTETGFSYCYSGCNGKYKFVILLKERGGILRILPSTICYKIKIFIDSSDVYKENGSVVLDLSNIVGNIVEFEIEIDKKQTILLSRIVNKEIYQKLIEVK